MEGDNLFWRFPFAEIPGFGGLAISPGNAPCFRKRNQPSLLAPNVASNDAAHLRDFNPARLIRVYRRIRQTTAAD